MPIITSETQEPPLDKMPGWVERFERDLDPWHEGAFPPEFKEAGTGGDRRAGWMALDHWGNPVGFIPDGTEYK